MKDLGICQSFSVDDIRRIRNEDAERYKNLNYSTEEISQDIHERAKAGYEIIERIRRERTALDRALFPDL